MNRTASRSTIRVLTVLSFITGAVEIASNQCADPLSFNRVQYVKKHCEIAVNRWAAIGDPEDAVLKFVPVFNRINENLNNIEWLKIKEEMNYPGMCYVAMQLLDDLMLLITDKSRSILLQNIYDSLTGLLLFIDPEGEMYLTQDRAQEIVTAIYDVVGVS